jgi:hypothetical protein
VGAYCERLGPGLFAEPLNALSNVAFFLAAWAAWSVARRGAALDSGITLLVALIATIGVGSTLFHTFSTPWARLMDLLPIAAFQMVYLWLYGRRVIRADPAWIAAFLSIFVVIVWGASQRPQVLNGSLYYAPAAVLSVVLGVYHRQTRSERRSDLLVAGATLFVAIFFRTIDAAVCPVFRYGTHFVWHLMIPLVAYLYLRALIPVGSRVLRPA